MSAVLTVPIAIILLGFAHILVVVQLDQGWFTTSLVPPLYVAFALDLLALLLVYWL